jgi:hypothetical protein
MRPPPSISDPHARILDRTQDGPVRSVYRMVSLPRSGRQVLGADLNCACRIATTIISWPPNAEGACANGHGKFRGGQNRLE